MTGTAVINKATVRKLGWEQPLGKKIRLHPVDLTVVGVVGDFHFSTFRTEIEPLMFVCRPISSFLSLRYSHPDVTALLRTIEDFWKEETNGLPFDYFFLDERFNRMYQSELRYGRLLRVFAVLTVFIATLGLLGLAAHATSRRTREIGIRKVLGAEPIQIVTLLMREFVLLVLLASLIAWPVAWYFMRDWLGQYAYQPPYGWWVYPAAGLGALLVAVLTVAALALRAANSNPAESLRHE